MIVYAGSSVLARAYLSDEPRHHESRALLEDPDTAMDAWHVAIASMIVPDLANGEPYGFASRDKTQAEVAAAHGFVIV